VLIDPLSADAGLYEVNVRTVGADFERRDAIRPILRTIKSAKIP